MKVTVRRANTGINMHDAIAKARKAASSIDRFRVQLWKLDGEWPVASWGTMNGDLVDEILKHGAWGSEYTAADGDIIKVIEGDTNKVIETILVNG